MSDEPWQVQQASKIKCQNLCRKQEKSLLSKAFPKIKCVQYLVFPYQECDTDQIPFFVFELKRSLCKTEKYRKNTYYNAAKIKRRAHDLAAIHRCNCITVVQIRNDIEHHHHSNTGANKWNIHPAIFPYAVEGQLRVKSCFHRRSPPVARSVSVSEIF